MDKNEAGRRNIKKKVEALLGRDDFDEALEEIAAFPARRVINPLISFLSSGDEKLKHRAVTAVGAVVSKLADEDIESAREIMRRLVWSLTEEAGAIGWGAPWAMGEIMSRHEKLAEEFHGILISYIDPGGDNFLEFEPLQKDALRGIERLAEVRPHLVKGSEDQFKR
jgi:hypothetical protein